MKGIGLAPSILSFGLTDLRESVKTMAESGAKIIHLDVMDGQFVPPITFGDAYVRDLRSSCDLLFEAHLMTLSPEMHFQAFRDAGCERIIFHAEATDHAHRAAQSLRAMGIEAGVAINPGTPAEIVRPLLEVVDLVLIMTVNPGWGGQVFIPECIQKVRQIRAWSEDVMIEVDGGIDPVTLPLVKEAGANVFVVGSYLARAHQLSATVKELVSQCD